MLVLFGLSFNSDAATPSIQILDRVDAAFKPLQNTWYTSIRSYAERLFWLLVLVDFGWTTVIYVLEKNDVVEIVTSLVKKVFTIGFFWGLLKFSDTWIPVIIDSFRGIGTTVGNVSSVTPDGIVAGGYNTAVAAFKIMTGLGALEKVAVVFPVTLVAIVTFLAFLFVAAQLLVTLIECYLVVGAGVILLGFGGSRWTTDFSTKYLQYAVGTGIKLMLIYLIVGAAQPLFDSIILDANHLMESTLAAMGSALVYAFLAIQVPQIASAMMSGSPSMTAGSLAGTAVALGAGIAGAGAATAATAVSAGAAGVGGVSGAAGLAEALGAGYNSSLDTGKSRLGAAAGAFGEVGKQGMGFATGRIGDGVEKMKAHFAEKMNASIGGQIASGIEATRGGSISSATSSSNGGSGGGDTAPTTSGGGGTGSSGAGNLGDASTASVSGGGSNPSEADSGSANAGRKDPLSEKIKSLQGYIPHDMASGASANIHAGHTAD
jgi:type IV secretion system protein TrbL